MEPFSEGDAYATFEKMAENIKREISALENEYVLKASRTELEKHFLEKIAVEQLVLKTSEKYIKKQEGIDIDVSRDFMRGNFGGGRITARGTRIDVAIPYSGNSDLFRLRGDTISLGGYPNIEILGDEIVFSVTFPDDNVQVAQIHQQIDRNVRDLESGVSFLQNNVSTHNNSAPGWISSALERKLQQARSSLGVLASLGIPVKRSGSMPTFSVPTVRRKPPVSRPQVPSGKYEPEPVLDITEYAHILEILRSMSLLIERNPQSFSALHEEVIRDHFLLQLNGHYEGSATGETFNASGKTDILIRSGNRNVFIAECKFWGGQKAFGEAIDQLLGYLTWRDTKSALLIFNKTKDSTSVRQKMHEVLELRAEFRKTLEHKPLGDSRYTLVKPSEPGREIILTTQLYDIPDIITSVNGMRE
jgi:hypothetical protein